MFMNLSQNLLKNIHISNIANIAYCCNYINIHSETLALVCRWPVTILFKRIPVVMENVSAVLLSEKQRGNI